MALYRRQATLSYCPGCCLLSDSMRLLTNSATFGLISKAKVSFDGANVDKATAKPPKPQPTSRNATFEPLSASRVGYNFAQSSADGLRGYGAASLWLKGLQWARLRKKRFWG